MTNVIHLFDPEDDDVQRSPVACNDAFIAAMNRAIKMKREKVVFGTYVDTTPFAARRYYGTPATRGSACGSPGAMCAESANPNGGASALK